MPKPAFHRAMVGIVCALCAFVYLAGASASAPQLATDVAPSREQANAPVEPFRIIGNVYYVGTFDYAIFLINTPAGNILIDSGWPDTAPLIEASIRKLGFRVEDIKWLLNSHGHADHIGGFAELKRLSGAKLVISEPDVAIVERGGTGPNGAPPVKVDRVLHDGDTIELGGVVLKAYATPGHEIGCMSFTMVAEENGKKYNVVFVGGIHPAPQGFKNPETAATLSSQFDHTFALLRSLPCDVPLVSHGVLFNLTQKRAMLGQKTNPFIDPQGYKTMLDQEEALYHQDQAAGKQSQSQANTN